MLLMCPQQQLHKQRLTPRKVAHVPNAAPPRLVHPVVAFVEAVGPGSAARKSTANSTTLGVKAHGCAEPKVSKFCMYVLIFGITLSHIMPVYR